MLDHTRSIPSPGPGEDTLARRIALCSEALAPPLGALSLQAEGAGWSRREIAAAVMAWAVTQATLLDGGEAVTEALMASLDMARLREPRA
ncbi:hypothetical protein J8J14_21440 [Roseomonas sp. SSH11]|uniref:Uncharacterized protein n=1 Tax=Pararoseomonas baculiformis TaxID=2820812 RepID=A0ABS4AJY5_9PROT|nr:hypothetical protein [Pararoseomonas baculiformis]MBP0447336.1 hypothetical protein [Pararoseomonas baculiformis]